MSVYRFRDFYIPERMLEGLRDYIENGHEPGSFLTAVICNDLNEACARADEENLHNLPAYVAYLYNEAPWPSWGSAEKMASWMERAIMKRKS
jgi:hypothetical protein